jgi:hypothetical protein
MANLKELRSEWEQAEAQAHKLQAEKDAAIDKIRERYTDRQRKANDEAARKQKVYLDADAAQTLADRADAEAAAAPDPEAAARARAGVALLAESLGLKLPE